jgi:hypothetical protein
MGQGSARFTTAKDVAAVLAEERRKNKEARGKAVAARWSALAAAMLKRETQSKNSSSQL